MAIGVAVVETGTKRLCVRLLSGDVVYEGCASQTDNLRDLAQLRCEVATTVGCSEEELVFCSGGRSWTASRTPRSRSPPCATRSWGFCANSWGMCTANSQSILGQPADTADSCWLPLQTRATCCNMLPPNCGTIEPWCCVLEALQIASLGGPSGLTHLRA